VSDEECAVDVVVKGRVQGVGFRDFCVRAAEKARVKGYAMNLRDGRVRVVAEGRRGALEALVSDLQRGPRMARVADVEVTWRDASAQFTEFTIRYDA